MDQEEPMAVVVGVEFNKIATIIRTQTNYNPTLRNKIKIRLEMMAIKNMLVTTLLEVMN